MGDKVKKDEITISDLVGDSDAEVVDYPTMDDPKVVCDFDGVSRRWGRDWSRINGEYQSWTLVAYEPDPEGLSDEQSAQLAIGRAEALKKLEELFDLRNALIAQVLISMPEDWLTVAGHQWLADNPGGQIDWRDEENLWDFVLESRTADLTIGVQYSRANASKK